MYCRTTRLHIWARKGPNAKAIIENSFSPSAGASQELNATTNTRSIVPVWMKIEEQVRIKESGEVYFM